MSDIVNKGFKLEDELKNLELVKFHPNGIVGASLNRLSDMLGGKVNIVDPSNPFTYLLETTCLNTAFAVQETMMLSRMLYPKLANNENDLYLHMSDVDYLGRFGEPAFAKVKFSFLFNDFKTRATLERSSGDYVLHIPRNYRVSIDEYIFSLTSGIEIRLTPNGVVDVKYLIDTKDKVFPLKDNLIDFEFVRQQTGEEWMVFEVEMPEVDLEATEIPLERSKLFKGKLNYSEVRDFYYLRAYHLRRSGWEEMVVSHNEINYDIEQVTCSIKVDQSNREIEYYIPPVYIDGGKVGSKVKFVIYTTKGPIVVNFNDFRMEDYVSKYNKVFPDLEITDYTKGLDLITKIVFIEGRVVGGKGPMSFSQLKRKVINNSIGDRESPVTRNQLEHRLEQDNFKIIRDVDIVTNRVFLLETDIPNSPSRYSVTNINFDILEYGSSLEALREGKNKVTTPTSFETIIPSGSIFKFDNNCILKMLSVEEADYLEGLGGMRLVEELNENKYFSTYYHYIVSERDDRVSLDAYDLSEPRVKSVSFDDYNGTTGISVNTKETLITKNEGGYILDIFSGFKEYSSNIGRNNISPYLVYEDREGSRFYLEGSVLREQDEGVVYRFILTTGFYINRENRIGITNFKDGRGFMTNVPIPLDSELELVYVTDRLVSDYRSGSIDKWIAGTYFSVGKGVVTREKVKIRFGYWLEWLYRRVHSSVPVIDRLRYTEDIPKVYEGTVFGTDNEILHHKGEVVVDEEGNTIYEHLRGDVILGEDGKALLGEDKDPVRYLNLLMIDYKATRVTDDAVKDYLKYLRSHMRKRIIEDAKNLQPLLLENTVGYVSVPRNLGDVKVRFKGREHRISSAQGFEFTLYIEKRVFEDEESRLGLEAHVRTELVKYLSENKMLSKGVLLNRVYEGSREFIRAISVDKFTEIDEEYIEVVDEYGSVGIEKILKVDGGGYGLIDNVVVNFSLVS